MSTLIKKSQGVADDPHRARVRVRARAPLS